MLLHKNVAKCVFDSRFVLAAALLLSVIAPKRLAAANYTYAISGQMQTYDFPPNNDPHFSSFVARIVIDDSLFVDKQACAAGISQSQAYFKIPAPGIVIYVTDFDGAKHTVNLAADSLYPGLVGTYCSGTSQLGHSTLHIGQGNNTLDILFDDERPRLPVIATPFNGVFAPNAPIRKGIFHFLGDAGSDVVGASYSAYVTCFTQLGSPASDPRISACGSPAAAIPRPHTLHPYAFSATSPAQKAQFFGTFVLDEANIYRTQDGICQAADLGVEQNSKWSSVAGTAGSLSSLTVVLPDGRTETTPASLNTDRVLGVCRPNADGSNTPTGPTTLTLTDGESTFFTFNFADAPPAAPAIVSPFAGVVPPTTHFSSTAFQLSTYFPKLKMFFLNVQGTLTCLAPMTLPTDDPSRSACGDNSNPAGAPPSILSSQGILNGASFQEGIAADTWVTIRGSNLSSTTRTWQASDFIGTALPTSLDGVRVTIGGKPAYVYYVSPTQINVLTPDDATVGSVEVQVVTPGGTSGSVLVTKSSLAPALFAYSQQSGRYAIAQDASSYALLGPAGLLGSGVATVPAVPGEIITLYATGLGPTNPSYPAGQIVPAAALVSAQVDVLFGNTPVTPQFAGASSVRVCIRSTSKSPAWREATCR